MLTSRVAVFALGAATSLMEKSDPPQASKHQTTILISTPKQAGVLPILQPAQINAESFTAYQNAFLKSADEEKNRPVSRMTHARNKVPREMATAAGTMM